MVLLDVSGLLLCCLGVLIDLVGCLFGCWVAVVLFWLLCLFEMCCYWFLLSAWLCGLFGLGWVVLFGWLF